MTSTARLQRESDAARVELADTLSQLRDGVAPSALSAEAIALAKDSGLSILKTLAEQARANPVPALLIGAGLTMLLTRTSGRDVMGVAGSTLKSAASAGVEAARGAASGMASGIASAATSAASGAAAAASSAASSAAGVVRGVAASATGAVDEMRQKAGAQYDSLKEKVHDKADASRRELHERQDQAAGMIDSAREQAAGLAGNARDQARRMADQTQQTFAQLMEEQPILMAALGAALGAAIGAAIPLSKTEKDMIGAAGARAVGAGREALSTAADVIREEARSADLGGKVGELADKVVQNVTKDIRHPV
jgi:ElaB/YqjD/DUF883 family membrane-anchored ribosome-binding protein